MADGLPRGAQAGMGFRATRAPADYAPRDDASVAPGRVLRGRRPGRASDPRLSLGPGSVAASRQGRRTRQPLALFRGELPNAGAVPRALPGRHAGEPLLRSHEPHRQRGLLPHAGARLEHRAPAHRHRPWRAPRARAGDDRRREGVRSRRGDGVADAGQARRPHPDPHR